MNDALTKPTGLLTRAGSLCLCPATLGLGESNIGRLAQRGYKR